MPYINSEDRAQFAFLEALASANTLTPGDLNYCITRLCDIYLTRKGFSYTHINDIVGVLECAKMELYRRLAVPYENTKAKTNGDVYKAEPPRERPRCPMVALTDPPQYCILPDWHEGPHKYTRE